MDSFDVWAAMVTAMGLAGAAFVLWIAPRVDARERRRVPSHPAE